VTAERPISDDDLHAAADGSLPPERQAEVDDAIAGSPDAAARVAFYRRLNAGLHAGYDFMLNEPVPERLTTRPQRLGWQALLRVAAAIALLAIGGGGGWVARDMISEVDPQTYELADLAAEAHLVYASQVSNPVEIPGGQKDRLLALLSKNLDRPVRAPDLTKIGYEFLGGRLLPSGRDMAGQLMYQNVTGNRVTLYFIPAADKRDSAFRFIPIDGVSVYYWHDDDLAYSLVSELPREQLKAICNQVYSDLNPNAGPVEW
jgi:anti-sigma factor RsiW